MRVLVGKQSWLGASETFIRNQVDAMRREEVLAVGLIREASPLVLPTDITLYGRSRIDRIAYQLDLRFGSRRLTRFLRARRIDLVHVHFAADALAFAPSARRAGVPLVVTLHGHDVTSMPRAGGRRGRRYRRRLRALFQQAALLVAVSEHIRDTAVALGADPVKVVVHHIGVPVPEVLPSPDGPPVDVLFIGRLTEKKGLDDLIVAVSRIPSSRRPRFAVVGDGPLRAEFTALAARLGVACEFLGPASGDQVQALLARSRVVVVPSKTAGTGDTEGLPTVAVEAGAAGVPVIGTRHAGIPEIVLDGRTGILVDERDPAGLASALVRLLDDAELRLELGAAARRRVAEAFDVRTQTAELEDLYERVRAGRPKRAGAA